MGRKGWLRFFKEGETEGWTTTTATISFARHITNNNNRHFSPSLDSTLSNLDYSLPIRFPPLPPISIFLPSLNAFSYVFSLASGLLLPPPLNPSFSLSRAQLSFSFSFSPYFVYHPRFFNHPTHHNTFCASVLLVLSSLLFSTSLTNPLTNDL